MGWFDGMDFLVTNDVPGGLAGIGAAVAAAGSGATAGGAVTMDRDEMTKFLHDVQGTQRKCQQQVDETKRTGRITPPAQDPASVGFGQVAEQSRDKRDEFLHQQLAMYNELVAKLQKALGLTVAADEQAADEVKNAAGDGADGGIY